MNHYKDDQKEADGEGATDVVSEGVTPNEDIYLDQGSSTGGPRPLGGPRRYCRGRSRKFWLI